jgi:hypothetical protein
MRQMGQKRSAFKSFARYYNGFIRDGQLTHQLIVPTERFLVLPKVNLGKFLRLIGIVLFAVECFNSLIFDNFRGTEDV